MKPIYKISIAVAILVIVAVIAFILWRWLVGEENPPATTVEESPRVGVTNGSENKITTKKTVIKKLSDQDVFDFWLVEDTGEIYYLNSSGNVLIAKDGPDLEISKQNISALNSIEVSPSTKKILAAFGDPLSPQWGVFDVVEKAWRPLPAEISTAAWGPNDERLVALIRNGNEMNLAEVDLTKTPPASKIVLRDFRLKDVRLSSLSPDVVIIAEKTSSNYGGRVWRLDLKSSAFNLVASAQTGSRIRAASPKKELYFWFKSPKNLSITDNKLNLIPTEFFFETLPEKCTAPSSTTIYCFEPRDIAEAVTLPDDYFRGKFYSIDDLLFVDITDSESSLRLVAASGEDGMPIIDGYHPQVGRGSIFFINRYDKKLYQLELP